MNMFIGAGYLTFQDYRDTRIGKVLNFGIAIRKGKNQRHSDFVNCVAREEVAKQIHNLDKGQYVTVTGTLIQSQGRQLVAVEKVSFHKGLIFYEYLDHPPKDESKLPY